MKVNQISSRTKVFFVNKTTKTAGSTTPLVVNKEKSESGKTKMQITFEVNRENQNDDIEYYFDKSVWLDEIRKM